MDIATGIKHRCVGKRSPDEPRPRKMKPSPPCDYPIYPCSTTPSSRRFPPLKLPLTYILTTESHSCLYFSSRALLVVVDEIVFYLCARLVLQH